MDVLGYLVWGGMYMWRRIWGIVKVLEDEWWRSIVWEVVGFLNGWGDGFSWWGKEKLGW